MKITSFNPLIVTRDSESAIALFEELGFARRHTKEGIGENNVTDVRTKDANGFHVDVSQGTGEWTMIRINVDAFDEAYAFLLSKGFANPKGDRTVDTKSNKNAMLVAPSGFAIHLCHHIKDHD